MIRRLLAQLFGDLPPVRGQEQRFAAVPSTVYGPLEPPMIRVRRLPYDHERNGDFA